MVYRFPSVQGRVQGWAVELATIIERWIKRVKLGRAAPYARRNVGE
jgi:hypothetical protein